MRIVLAAVAAFIVLGVAACGGGGGVAATGTIGGKVTVGGPINGAVELLVGLVDDATDQIVDSATAGHVVTAATASLSGRQITFSFDGLALGTYRVVVFSQSGAIPTYWYQGDPITLSAATPSVTNFSEDMSFSGPGPWGTISGVVLPQGNTTWPAASLLTFIGFNKTDEPTNILQWLVSEDDLNGGHLVFNVDHLDFGDYNVGFYGYNPVTHAVSVYGIYDHVVTISAGDVNATNVNFPSDFDGDPGADGDFGTINGTITFNGDLPAGQFISVGANTIPPQAGAPIASFDVAPEDLDGNHQVNFVLAGLPADTYSVAIFSYDFNTHQATYFGEYNGTVIVDADNLNFTGIDFDADVTLIGGQ
jgi:hypothetical protein